MSAFVVSTPHIDALLTAAKVWNVLAPHRAKMTFTEWGAMLLKVNTEAVFHRYEGRHGTDAPPEPYTFKHLGINIQAVKVIKAIRCYEYQSCEHHEWETSNDPTVKLVRDMLDGLLCEAIRRLPGYEAAPWGIDDETVFGDLVMPIF